MPDRKFLGQNYRFGFNGKENDNEVKGFANQQDYGMRVYDPRIARFLSVDPISKDYPNLTPYQFASNRPIDGVDQDGLEFLKYNESYIKMLIDYNPKLKTVQATTYYRVGESQRDRWPGRTILNGKLEERIKNTPSNCDCVTNYDARVTNIHFASEQQDPEMQDAEEIPENVSPSEFKRTYSENKKRLDVDNSKQFSASGVSNSINKWNGRLVMVEAAGVLLQGIGELYTNSIVKDAHGYQSRKAADVLNLIQYSIQNGTIKKKYLNNESLTHLANYLLYGADVEDKDLEKLAKEIWQGYSGAKALEKLLNHDKATKHNPVDNVGVKNRAGFEP